MDSVAKRLISISSSLDYRKLQMQMQKKKTNLASLILRCMTGGKEGRGLGLHCIRDLPYEGAQRANL